MSNFIAIFRRNFDQIAKWPLICIASVTAGSYAIDRMAALINFMKGHGVSPFQSLMVLGAVWFICLAIVATLIDWWNRRTCIAIASGNSASEVNK